MHTAKADGARRVRHRLPEVERRRDRKGIGLPVAHRWNRLPVIVAMLRSCTLAASCRLSATAGVVAPHGRVVRDAGNAGQRAHPETALGHCTVGPPRCELSKLGPP